MTDEMMPRYDYKCPKCGSIEKFQHPDAKHIDAVCLTCGINYGRPAPQMKRQFSTPTRRGLHE